MDYGYRRYLVFGIGCLFSMWVLLFALPEDCGAELDGLVAVWLLDEEQGDITKDASGNGHDGEVAIFDRALSEAEINELMNKGLETSLAVSASGKLAATWGKIRVRY